MKLIFAVVIGAVLHCLHGAAIDDLESEFDKIEKDLAANDLEKELLGWKVPEWVKREEEQHASNSPVEVKDASHQANSVESQLEDLLKTSDLKATKKESDAKSELHNKLAAFEKTGTVDKDALIKAIAHYLKKDDQEADVPSEDSGKCKDVRKNCKFLAQKGYCGSHKAAMEENCAKTCEFCVECSNIAGDKCVAFQSRGLCKSKAYEARLKHFCFKQCGYCKTPSPPMCATTKHGCCWDKTTALIDKVGSNCPKCKDRFVYVCDRFRDDCAKDSRAGSFMRKACPKSCGSCGDKCKDTVEWADKCPYYSKTGMCKTNPHGMKVLCEKTCGFC